MTTSYPWRLPNQPNEPALDRTLVAAFLENVPDAVYFKDRAGRFIAVSRSKSARHGLSPQALVGQTDEEFYSATLVTSARSDEEAIMSTGEPIVGKLERTHWRDGGEGWAEVTKMPLRDMDGEIIGTFGITRDVTDTQELKIQLEKAQRNLLDASRTAGMAEVATGVLHNIGNVLTSLNVSANMIATSLHQSRAESLLKLSNLLNEHASDLGDFTTNDPKGRRVPDFMDSLAKHGAEERDRLVAEVESLQQNIDHIKEIVSMQQAYATMLGVVERLDPTALMEDALRMNAGALVRHDITVERVFSPVPPIISERAKVLQILVNLIRNAKYAADEGRPPRKTITLRVEPGEPGYVRLVVQDNGIGIPAENLGKLFSHGFTTRANGHGFGLHSSAIVAADIQATLTAHSDGPGCGAVFTLALPTSEVKSDSTGVS